MKRFLLLALGLGLGMQAHADVNSVDRSKRNFRLDPTTGVVYADLVVAYQDLPAFLSPSGSNKVPNPTAFLAQAFKDASLELFKASKGAVQLGKVTIVPASFATNGSVKSDPDVVILADAKATECPDNLLRPEEVLPGGVPVCADANTGGYLGLAWWLPTTTIPNDPDPIFQRVADGKKISAEGTRIALSWNTLATHGAKVLVHEFGHYLFAMRDEYEGPIFSDYDAFEAATPIVPTTLNGGIALSGGNVILIPDQWKFNGYGMGLLSKYQSVNGYSNKDLPALGAGAPGWPAFPGTLDEGYVVTEQIASVSTRREIGTTTRGGGMWSLETAIRTGLNKHYTPVQLPESNHNTLTEAQVTVYGSGQANVFVFDRSGSMASGVTGDNSAGVTKWDAAVDFFGRLTHPEGLGANPTLAYPAGARFGFVDFDDIIEEKVAYPATLDALKVFTIPYLPVSSGVDKKLSWASNPASPVPVPRGLTNLVGALAAAQADLDKDTQKPFQRNVILLSDGLHNYPVPGAFTGNEGKDGKYRVFSVTVDTKLDDNGFGTKMQNLAQNSVGPEGVSGFARFTNGDNTQGLLSQAANDIFNAINQMDLASISPSQLYRDAAQEFVTSTDLGQKQVQFAMSWAGNVAPVLYLTLPNGQTFLEGNGNGITFRQGKNFKSFDIDLTKFPLLAGQTTNQWKLRATSSTDQPITIFPSVATKSSKLQVNVSFDPKFVSASGRLPVTVVVQDGRPIQGLQVNATLRNRATGVIKAFPLTWNGSAYVGVLAGNIQPGLSDLAVSVVHPNNGKVFYAAGENRLPDALRTPYPYFAARQQSQQVWVDGAAALKRIAGLEAYTINTQPNNAQGTALKLFLKNGTQLPLTGLKVRYFYSVSEYANGTPSFSTNYLPQSKVTVGNVLGRPGLAFAQFDFTGQTLQPGASTSNGVNGGEALTLIESQWRSPWNSTNDWSAQGLKTSWAVNGFVNIYDAGDRLISGNPDLERVGIVDDAQPIVALTSPDLVAVGIPASFVANAVDPENEALTYTWKVDGVQVTPNPGTPSKLVYTFLSAGNHSVSVSVWDRQSNPVTISKQVVVQTATGACTDQSSRDLGVASSNLTVDLVAGSNCFVIKQSSLVREWNWSSLYFQANSDNGVALGGLSVSPLPAGAPTTLGGYSQTITLANPSKTSLYIKVQASSARKVRLNWWLQ